MFEHVFYKTQLISFQEFFIKKVFVELYGYFNYFFTLAFVRKPGMVQVRPDKHQLHIIYHLDMPADDPFGAFGVEHQVQLVFFMIMQREIELLLNL